MENTDFINLYIQHLVSEITELTKTKVLGAARESYKDAEIGELKRKLAELEVALANEKDTVAQTWKSAFEEKEEATTKAEKTVINLQKQLDIKTNANAVLTAKVDEMHRDIKNKEAIIASLNEKLSKRAKRANKGVNTSNKNQPAVT